MNTQLNDEKQAAQQEMRSIMNRSARIITLSGWAGIWTGLCALAGAAIAWKWIHEPRYQYLGQVNHASTDYFDAATMHFIYLGLAVFIASLAGVLFFTHRKAKRNNLHLWNYASQQMVLQLFFPILAGGVFPIMFIYYGCGMFVVPACLTFYGLALISASRLTLSDIRYLGMLEVMLGCTGLFVPGLGLYFAAIGFGVLHILYGGMMWNKYDNG